jgi:chromosome segregation ATPase
MKSNRAARHAVKLGTAWCAVAAFVATAIAQDVPGIEICTHESRMDRRTGCLQSNVDFLQQEVTKNALGAEQKLSAANREIAALRQQFATASREAAALKDALAAMEARIAQLEKAAPQPKADGNKAEGRPQGK